MKRNIINKTYLLAHLTNSIAKVTLSVWI